MTTPDTTRVPDVDAVIDALTELRARTPLVQALTNYVAAGFTANVLLAAGASPAMVDNVEEAGLFAGVADAVLINLGTPQSSLHDSYVAAATAARAAGTPWVLDPIAAGGLPWRGELARELLAQHPSVIRGNASEVIGLHGLDGGGRGVDSSADPAAAVDSARALLESADTVSASGPVDHVVGTVDGHPVLVKVSGGSPLLTKVTGTGCSLGALVAAYAAVAPDALTGTVAAHTHVAVAADIAGEMASAPGSFVVAYLDALHDLGPDDIRGRAQISH
jgi:hydroxyethylthiazole kinase